MGDVNKWILKTPKPQRERLKQRDKSTCSAEEFWINVPWLK